MGQVVSTVELRGIRELAGSAGGMGNWAWSVWGGIEGIGRASRVPGRNQKNLRGRWGSQGCSGGMAWQFSPPPPRNRGYF